MGNVIQTNVSSIAARGALTGTNNDLGTTFKRLSTGFRINSAADDASGLFVSNQLTSQIGGLTVAIRNANDGISIAQTAEGGMAEATNILHRMRDLAVQAASGQTADNGAEKAALDAEYQALGLELTRIGTDTSFGSQALLSGANTYAIQVSDKAAGIDITVTTADITGLNEASGTIGDLTNAVNATAALTNLDLDIAIIDTARGALGAVQNRLTSTVSNLQSIVENVSASRSRIRDTDFAVETANLAKNQVLQQAGLSVLAQANGSAQSVLSLLQ